MGLRRSCPAYKPHCVGWRARPSASPTGGLLIDSHVLKQTETAGEIAVKYRASLSADTAEIVSLLVLSKEGGVWKIGKEKIHASRIRHDGRASSQGSGDENVQFDFGGGAAILNPNDGRRGGCANGRCGL